MEIKERRVAPRFKVSLNARLISEFGHQCDIKVTNISSSGLQFSAALQEMPRLLPQSLSANRMQPMKVILQIQLRSANSAVKVQCGIVYVQRASASQCMVGCRFEQFIDGAQQQLEVFISKL